MKKIENFMLPEHFNQIYRNEAVSSISLVRDTADKINELIDAYNELSETELEKIQEQDGRIDKAIIYMKDNLLNAINQLLDLRGEDLIERNVKEYLGYLQLQLNNLLGQVKEGSTTLDAELIDGRLGQDGVTYKTLGQAIRTQFSYTNLWRSVVENDCDKCLQVGHYFIGSGVEWKNVPGDIQSGVLIVYNGNSPTRLFQQFQNYNGELYLRNLVNGVFSEWKSFPKNENTLSLKTGTAGLESCDLNNVLETGSYRLSSAYTYENSPSVAGLLIVYGTSSPNQYYQMFLSYDGSVYTRCYVNGYMYEWRKLAVAISKPDETINDNKNYSIIKEDDSHLNIYKKGVNGFIKYQYLHEVKEDINLDIWRLGTIDLCDLSKNVVKNISQIGADVEGVVLLEGDSDHLGGVHGDEQLINYYLFVDGKQYTFENVPNMDCDEVRIIVDSNITHQDSSNVCMKKNKQTTFDKDGVSIKCKWKALEELNIESIRACMLSIQKECFTHYYDSNVITSPIEKANTSNSSIISEDKNIVDMYYIGDIIAHHFTKNRGGNDEKYSTIVQDYGYRLKTYFNCYDNYKTSINEELKAENNFYISC